MTITDFQYYVFSGQLKDLKLEYWYGKGPWKVCANTTDHNVEGDTLVCTNNHTPLITSLRIGNLGTDSVNIKDINIYASGMI